MKKIDEKAAFRNRFEVVREFEKRTGHKEGDILKRIMFETSEGTVTGSIVATVNDNMVWDGKPYYHVNEERVTIDTIGMKKLENMYKVYCVELAPSGWVVVRLDDEYCGNPEYRYEVME